MIGFRALLPADYERFDRQLRNGPPFTAVTNPCTSRQRMDNSAGWARRARHSKCCCVPPQISCRGSTRPSPPSRGNEKRAMISVVFAEIVDTVRTLAPLDIDCRAKIIEVRQSMDSLCDQGKLTISDWRVLLDQTSAIQARCVARAVT